MSIEIYRDPWGIPHLRAGGSHELAFAQGHNAASDRAWQIEVERHRAQGTTATFLGVEAIAWDRFARQACLDDTARRCFTRLDRETTEWVRSYVDGVNAGLVEGAARAPEFAATGLAPGRWQPWTPLGVWLSHHILFAGFPSKLWREEVVRRLGSKAIELFATDGPRTAGSNGWLVAGERTASGAALLAGDPHRFIEDPGMYQQVHLACPEYDVVGLAVPGVPGIAHFGHTGSVAWAITNAMADYQDLYRERLRRNGIQVEALGPDGWLPATTHLESITVAGARTVEIEVIETERGPVIIGGLGDDGEAISLRYPARVREDLGFAALPALLRARTVGDVDRALDGWAEPVNVVQAADTAGGLLHRVAGAVPLRPRDNSLRVVSAWDPAHAWRGWHPLPREAVHGIAVMANQRGLAAPLGVEFAPRHRERRIRQLLDAGTAWSAEDMAAIHTDTQLASARPLLDLVADLKGLSSDAENLRDQLLGWDRRMAADSTEATSYAAVRSALVLRLAVHPALAGLAETPTCPEVFLPWLALVPRIGFALEGLLTTALLPDVDRAVLVAAAVEDVAAGAPPGAWSEVHRLAPWRALPSAKSEQWPGLAGDHDCVLATSGVPGLTEHSTRGPAARYVWDLARREDSLWVVPFGASGVPGDTHRRDQQQLWLLGELVPVVTDFNKLTKERDVEY